MLMNLIFAAMFAGLSFYMFGRAHFDATRRVAYVLVGACVTELMLAGMLSLTDYPVLTAILLAARAAMLLCGVGALRADKAMVARRAEQRRAFARKMRCAEHPLQVVPQSSSAARSTRTAHCA